MRHAAIVFALALATVAAADSPTAEGWASTLKETTELLRDKQFDKALPRLEKLTEDMFVRLGPGEASDRMFAVALGQLAVAQAGAGKTDDAIWTWQVAQNIHPAVAKADLSPYGDAVNALEENILGPRPEQCALPMGTKAPAVVKRAEPRYPAAMRQFRESGIIIIQITVDDDGRPTHPEVLKPLAAPLTYAALEALRKWRFEATEDATRRTFCMTMNFKLH